MTETLPRPSIDATPAPAFRAALPVLAVFDDLSYWYPGSKAPALDRLSFEIQSGLTLVSGDSASGKSSLLRVLNGLVPHFHGGRIRGDASVLGQSVVATPTRHLAREVGFVFQDPETQFVFHTVEQEVAFGPENLGLARTVVASRLDEALAAVGITRLRERRISTLSGGQKQRVALAAALAMGPRVLALDEPTSQLDPSGADAFLRSCVELARQGASLVVAEHRVERLLAIADRMLLVERSRAAGPGPVSELVQRMATPPMLVALGRRLGWDPVPLTIEEARRLAPHLPAPVPKPAPARGDVAWGLSHVALAAGPEPLLEDLVIAGVAGEVVVLMGDNGTGKTTLLRSIAGLVEPLAGTVERRPGRIAYLPQDPSAILHQPTVRDEVQLTLSRSGSGECPDLILEQLGLLAVADRYPRDLSGGERQRTAIAAIIAGTPSIVLLDEPTRGMDGTSRQALAALVMRVRDAGSAVVLATHDVDLAAEVGDRVLQVGGGRVSDLGPPNIALSGEAEVATQVGRLYPGGPVTVDGVLECLGI